MNFRDLEYFTQLVHKKNFTKVANFFQVSQPTVTYAIQRLEKELDAILITRDQSHNAIHLTTAGEAFAHYAETMIHELASAKKAIQSIQQEKIRFSLPPIIGNYYFPKISAQLKKNHLLESFVLVEGGSRDLFKLFKDGKVDMGLIGSITPIRENFVSSRILAEKRFVIVVNKQHPLANRKKIRFEELVDEDFLILNEHFIHSLALKEFATQAHIHTHIAYESSDLSILKSMIEVGVGIGFLTELAISPTDNLVQLTLEDENQPTFFVSLLRSLELPDSPLYQKMVHLIEDVLTETV